ncbi:hypothetical protein ACJ72_01131 [Emergomyces africanus]|uniref:AB hydrolase-1 domain-containing protein n=1 Tax=Emergomyces africanus TaxID=1955775 RepID=A0A1B7P635_9EURO|nr:hypothetical protein ACJ72_01131 [Emergomyces africanus]
MITDKPSIVFLPGAWNGPECFGDVTARLNERGYEVHALHLPTAGLDAKSTPGDDIALVQKTTQALADGGKDVILVMHSYGGFVGSESAKGLLKTDRLAEGKEGGIVHLVYLAGLPGIEGNVLVENAPEWVNFQGEWTTVENAQEIFYNDLPSSMVDDLAAKLLPHAASIYSHPLGYAGYKHVPSTYLLCNKDLALPFKIQKAIVALAHGSMRSETCDAGHFCMLSMPEKVTDVIIKAAGISD